MEDIIAMAERLGKAISALPQAAALRQAQAAMQADEAASKLLADFQAHTQKMGQLEAEQKPVEVEDKHKLEDLHKKLIATETFKTLTAAQVEYVDVMRRVNDAIRAQMREPDSSQQQPGTGN